MRLKKHLLQKMQEMKILLHLFSDKHLDTILSCILPICRKYVPWLQPRKAHYRNILVETGTC